MKNLSLTFCLGIAALFGGVSVSWGNDLETCLSGKFTSLCNKSLLTSKQLTQVQNAERAENLKTCISGKFTSLCNKSLLTSKQLTQVQNAEKFIDKNQVSSAIYSSSSNMSYLNTEGVGSQWKQLINEI